MPRPRAVIASPVALTKNGWSMAVLMTTQHVAFTFGVNPNTVTRWSREGHLVSVRTIGGHRRFSAEQIQAIVTGSGQWLDHKPETANRQGANPR